MNTHIGLGLAALLTVAALPAQAQTIRGRTLGGAGERHDIDDPRSNDLVAFWAEQYGYRYGAVAASFGPMGTQFTTELLSKAPKDECFFQIGIHTQITPEQGCPFGTIEKANEMYLWGMAIQTPGDTFGGANEDVLWMGTGANTPCVANGSLGGSSEPSIDDVLVCEYGESLLAQRLSVWPDGLGDLRPARMLRGVIDNTTGELTLQDLTEDVNFIADFQLLTTAGIRAVGVCDGVVLFAGPALVVSGAINMWAFSTDGQFLGSTGLLEYANIRSALCVDGELYLGVLNSWDNENPGGSVLRWTGDADDPFQFETVATLDNEVAELVVEETITEGGTGKRLIAGTWPRLYGTLNQTDELYGLFRSPELPLAASDADSWEQIFRIDQYEPDPVTARAIASGALAFFDGYVWFGTLVTVGIPALAWIEEYGIPLTEEQINEVILGTYRPLTLFRGRMVEGVGEPTFEVEVVYGNEELPVYDFFTGFSPQPTGLGAPIEGLGGFNELFNTYLWDAVVGADGLLYAGTLDNAFSLQGLVLPGQDPLQATGMMDDPQFGADLYVFSPSSTEARAITKTGFDVETTSGIRNLVRGTLGVYTGTASVSNISEQGGWELRRVVSPLMEQ